MWFSQKIVNVLALIYTQAFIRLFIGKVGRGSKIIKPLKVDGIKNIHLGNNVTVDRLAWLAAMPLTGLNKQPELIIEDGARIGHFAHIYATSYIRIGENALIADKVYISDNLHKYSDVTLPVLSQEIEQLEQVSIGEGCWIGENVCVIGASIGKNSVVGANSVVTKDVPDYCVAVGSPARIIKRYCFEDKAWKKTNTEGSFMK